tara:strand:+ start:822 stop:1685 length:864 start_codon:yes stop_codon:yes gene_type:complete
MFSLKQHDLINFNFNANNCIYSTSSSRPSKTLINCDLYKEFSKINLNLDILNEFSYINNIYKNKDHLLIHTIINVFKLNNIEIDSIVISYDFIIVSEMDNNDLYFCFDNNLNLRDILSNLITLIKEFKNNDCLIITYFDLYSYSSAELYIIINYLFKKTKIFNCKLIKKNIIYCINFQYDQNIINYLEDCYKNWNGNSYIKQFGININDDILNKIKNFNNSILNYYINMTNNLVLSTIVEKEYFLKNYIKKYVNNKNDNYNCNHIIKEFNLYNCYICSKCYELFHLY